jgi:hypothetical protein
MGGLNPQLKVAPSNCQLAARWFNVLVIIRPQTAPPIAGAAPPLVQSKSVRQINSNSKPIANPVTIARKNTFIKKPIPLPCSF